MWVYNASPAIEAESQYGKIVAVSITLTVIMSVIVFLRGYVRAVMLKAVGLDDWVILFGALCTISYNALCIGQTRWGLGLTVAARPQKDLDSFSVLNYAGKPIYVIGILAFKVSLCLSYLRILNNSTRRYRQIIWLVLITCIAGHLGGALVLIFLCSPVEKSWKPLVPGYCIPNANTVYGLGAVSIFYDLIILILPIPLLAGLQISMRKRVGLVGVFCLGVFTTLCSIMRLTQITSILATGDQTGLVLWATIEMNIGTSLTCLPTLIPLFKYYRDKSTSRNGAYNLDDSHGNRLAYLTSATRTTKVSTPGWKDRESIDNSSQKQILRLESALHDADSNENLDHGKGDGRNRGITTTTEVRVEVSHAEENHHDGHHW